MYMKINVLNFRDFNEMDGDWLVIVDDDTIFSVARMLQMLSCYNHQHNIVIGERLVEYI